MMVESFERQVQTMALPAFNIHRTSRFKERDLNDVVRTLEGVLPRYMDGNVDTKVILSELDLRIMADVALVHQAMINLVKNAMDAMPNGGNFSIETSRANFQNGSIADGRNGKGSPCAFISFVDTGYGIDENIKGRIFEPSFTTKRGKAAGLGLPIAHHIIKLHGGSMNVESVAGRGTAINVYLPLVRLESINRTAIALPDRFRGI
ncbi:MAG TPA: hypothetical protein DDZ40_03520 [Deltaproteobacteria bacterium]|nr:hypothetical protein [Deltaproteobacteria bacterium]